PHPAFPIIVVLRHRIFFISSSGPKSTEASKGRGRDGSSVFFLLRRSCGHPTKILGRGNSRFQALERARKETRTNSERERETDRQTERETRQRASAQRYTREAATERERGSEREREGERGRETRCISEIFGREKIGHKQTLLCRRDIVLEALFHRTLQLHQTAAVFREHQPPLFRGPLRS
ncbi:unnamed protein product, partial [Pylaiella littoralis]